MNAENSTETLATTTTTDAAVAPSPQSQIDNAIAAAIARQAARNANNAGPKASPGRKPLTDAERTARDAKRAEERDAKKATRDAARAEKQAAREASKKTPHLAKVEKAAAKLPSLSADAQVMFDSIRSSFGRGDIDAIAQHLLHYNRVQATAASIAGVNLAIGQKVTISTGKYAGQVGTVNEIHKIRCYVDVPGVNERQYFFTADVTPVVEETANEQQTGTEG